MRRLACVELPELPLQMVLRQRPEWTSQPVAVVDVDKPQGRILWVNEPARRLRILPGLRYAAALSLSGDLRAAVVPSWEIEQAIESVTQRLRNWTPEVEPSKEVPGVFWLNASGLNRPGPGLKGLWRSLFDWARRIRRTLKRWENFESTVVVGFSKFATFAVAKVTDEVLLLPTLDAETEEAFKVPLERLAIPPKVRDNLAKFGIHSVGEFVALPAAGVLNRFGEEAWKLYRLARGDLQVPFEAEAVEEPLHQEMHLEHPEEDIFRLTALMARRLQVFFEVLSHRGEALASLKFQLRFDYGGHLEEELRPAAPTMDGAQIADLIRLRLESLRFPSGVTDVVLWGSGSPVVHQQLSFFASKPARDVDAADRALDRIRAQFGEATVVRAQLREGHLPEARFYWERLESLAPFVAARSTVDLPAAPALRREAFGSAVSDKDLSESLYLSDLSPRPVVRRIFSPSQRLPARPRHEPDGWMLRGLEQGPVVRAHGPYIVSGGWWRQRLHREYHFVETQKGEVLWVYYDRYRRRWCIQGRVF